MTVKPVSHPRHPDRAAGVVLASAAGDALGAPHEFGPALPADHPLAMTGGGPFGWAPGEWTDDTQQAAAVLDGLTRGDGEPLARIEAALVAWYDSDPADVGVQTRAVFERARRDGTGLAAAAAAHQAAHPDAAGNGSLMRTGVVGLASADLDTVADLAARLSALTHPHPDAVDACVLWSIAVARALDGPGGAPPDWVGLVAAGLDHLDPARRPVWAARLEACRTEPPEAFTPNGWVVAALQAALAAIAQTGVPDGDPPAAHLRLAIERAVRAGGDTDTVAAIAGALVGAHWGAAAVPAAWRDRLHGRLRYDRPPWRADDIERAAHLVLDRGRAA
jgi:ADP-ribosylglycohydrolase